MADGDARRRSQSLVIVESPAKASTIGRYLGDDFVVLSSKGHVRDLPEGGSLGVDPDNGWAAEYQVSKGREADVQALRSAARKASQVYLATDRDREGEAIAWNLSELLDGLGGEHLRVVFNEVTKGAILDAFSRPGQINQHLVDAQQARRFLDRVVGYKLSPLLWKKLARGLSAGRVQSVALRILVERERQIRAFCPQEYWLLHVPVARGGAEAVLFDVPSLEGEKLRIESESQMLEHRVALQAALGSLKVGDCTSGERLLNPSPPLITSTMQREASARLGMGVQRTMRAAQNLYEKGHITYMRTDAVNVSEEALRGVRSFLQGQYHPDYLPERPRRYKTSKRAQESHEAIRPTEIGPLAPLLARLGGDEARIYDLVWRRFVASQMQPARVRASRVRLEAGGYLLEARGREVVFDGFAKVVPWSRGEDRPLPGFEDLLGGKAGAASRPRPGDPGAARLQPGEVEAGQHFTKPPPRFSEAALIRELENAGIGRPSTYQSIIQTLQRRGYVEVQKRAFHVQSLGDAVVGRLVGCFPDLMDFGFTARMEDRLDEIADGKLAWRVLLDDFYGKFKEDLASASAAPEEGGMKGRPVVQTAVPCIKCGRGMTLRLNQSGFFLACPAFADKEEPCDGIRRVSQLLDASGVESGIDEAESQPAALQDERESEGVASDRAYFDCPECGAAMMPLHIDAAWRLYLCGRYPECLGARTEQGNDFRLGGSVPSISCDRCQGTMELRQGRFGPYYDCLAPDCDNKRKATADGQPLPPRMKPVPMPDLACAKAKDHFVLREGKAGLFLAASGYPKHRESRSPLVSELAGVADQLPEKYRHLAEAPTQDPDGNATVLRFSRTRGEHYLGSLKGDKYSSWAAYREGGGWKEGEAPARQSRPASKRRVGAKARKAAKTTRGARGGAG